MASSFVLERRINGGSWELLASLDGGQFSYIDLTAIDIGSQYEYRIKKIYDWGAESDWSNEVSVIVKPTVTFTVTAHGEITDTGGENCTKRGFVYSKVSHSTPGNVAPIETSYDNYVEEVGNFAAGPFFSMWRG